MPTSLGLVLVQVFGRCARNKLLPPKTYRVEATCLGHLRFRQGGSVNALPMSQQAKSKALDLTRCLPRQKGVLKSI